MKVSDINQVVIKEYKYHKKLMKEEGKNVFKDERKIGFLKGLSHVLKLIKEMRRVDGW